MSARELDPDTEEFRYAVNIAAYWGSEAGRYEAFLASKRPALHTHGFSVDPSTLNAHLFAFQRDAVTWALRLGRAALFLDCGLGKTLLQLEWARQVHAHTGGDVLILAPLAVARQTEREGQKFGIPVTVCRDGADVRPGINVTNYERLDRFDATRFAGVVLDESSILKAFSGITKRALLAAFRDTPYRLCCTATPAPNDHTELGNHAEFLGVMSNAEMLSRWFINDTMAFGTWRLKRHAEGAFWDWVASWALTMRRPSDLGYPDEGFDLPPLTWHEIVVPVDRTADAGDHLFRVPGTSATEIYREMRRTAPARAAAVAEMVNASPDAWALWCNTNDEADELRRRIPDAIEVRGSDSPEDKERKLAAFGDGAARVIISKPRIAGFGLNWQHCHQTAFVGLSYSFEQLFQAVRRTHRFGQTRPVDAYIVIADTEDQVLATVKRKAAEYERLFDNMNQSTSRLRQVKGLGLSAAPQIEAATTENYTLYHGDCVEAIRQIPDNSVHFSIFSPPFSGLYIYSDSIADMGNSADDAEFFTHFGYLIPELKRVTLPGRLCAVHCKQLVNYKGRDGMAGLRDFRGDLIRAFTAVGWAYHSEVCIWKDPVIEMQRTKAHGLLYKQLRADSTFSRQGMAEYLLVFRRWPETEDDEARIQPVTHTRDDFPLPMWQRYASPVWDDIRQTNVLNVQLAREDRDEKHICPLQLDVIERAIELWTNPGDVVLDPFAGIGSSGYVALPMGRRFVGIELKRRYWEIAARNLESVRGKRQLSIFDTEITS